MLPRAGPPTGARVPGQAVQPARPGPGRRPPRLSAGHLAHRHQVNQDQPERQIRSRFLAIRVRPANPHISRNADGSQPEVWLLAEWPPKEPEPTKYWLSNMDTITPLKTLVRLAKIRWRVEHHYRELKTGLGLDHVEGRSFIGRHRHVTLVCLAQAFCTLLPLDPEAPAPA